jgi:hypothetical protein
MKPKERLILDLLRLVQRHGADEFLALAKAIRDPALTESVSLLFERVAQAKGRTSARRVPRSRLQIASSLAEAFPTIEALDPILRGLKLEKSKFSNAESAYEAILKKASSSKSALSFLRKSIQTSGISGDELGRLTQAIVSTPAKKER